MRSSWKLGRVAGIDLYLHPTFLLILFYQQAMGGGAVGLALLLATFGCVVLHEFGHALTARRFGIATRDITLYPIGGVASLAGMPKSPKAEILIALAGPAVNVAIIFVLSAFGLLKHYGGWGVGFFLLNLILINAVLAVFNMIPAFPMDGGRVLRAALSYRLGRRNATVVAAGIGRFLAVAFGVFSVVQGRYWNAALAVFIFMAAGAEMARVIAEEDQEPHDRGSSGDSNPPRGYRWVRRGEGAWATDPRFRRLRRSSSRTALAMKSIFELGVDEAYEILTERFKVADLPPLEAIEFENWGRDRLLSCFLAIPSEELAEAGLTLSDDVEPVG